LRARASEILAYAEPRSMEMPPFESLQTQSATSTPRVRQRIPLAWAAMVIMALGLGWFGRGLQQQGMREIATSNDTQAPAAAPMSTRVDPQTEISAQEEMAEAQESRMMPAAPAPVPAPSEVGRVAGDMAATVRERAAVGNAVSGAAVELGQARVATAEAIEDKNAGIISAAEAERRNLVIARIPELPVVRVLISDGPPVTEQSLPDGKIIRVSEQVEVAAAPPPAPPPAAAPTVQGESRKVARKAEADAVARPQAAAASAVRAKTYVVTGDLPADSLRALAEKVR
jgi:hypothetical protein